MREARATLVPHARVHRREVRGEPWAVLQNTLGGEQVRLNEAALEIALALDGERTVGEVFAARHPDGEEASREAFAHVLLTLESAGLARLGRVEDTVRLVARARASNRRRRLDPLALRLPLHDPDAWLGRLAPSLAWLHGGRVRTLCAALVALATLVAFASGERLLAELSQVAASPRRWWLYALLWPALKLVHELAHALAVKRHGGAVHEAGITLLVLMPVPYVDASDSARFERRAARLGVAAAGMLAEGVLAAAALLLWSVSEPGFVHDAALAAALLGSVSTLLFNANPLLRFDGYQILQELLDMPNLGTRASAYLGWLFRRHVLRAQVPRPPLTGPRERVWLALYGLASLGYRWLLTFGIALYLAAAVPLLGVPLALFALYRLLLRPLPRALRYLRRSPELAAHRSRATLGCAGAGVAAALGVALVPLPSSTRVEGVVRAPPGAALHAAADGFVQRLPLAPGARVRAGEVVLELAAPELAARRARLAAELAVLDTRRRALLGRAPVEAARLDAERARARGEAAALERDLAALAVRAPLDGRFAPSAARLARGRGVSRGEVLGHVVADGGLEVEAVVGQRAVGRLREGVRAVRLRLAERVGEVLESALIGQTPAGDRRLPSAALAFDGTRGIAVASADGAGGELRTLEPVFHVELALPPDAALAGIGERVYVTLVHAPESIGRRGWRAARQLFLEKLSL